VTQIIDYDPFVAAQLQQVIATTPAQKEIWSAARMGQGASCAFNESISLHFRGHLDVAALRQALGQLVEQHEALRSTLSPFDGRLCIASELAIELSLEDLSGLPSEEQQQRLGEVLTAEVETPFDLEQGPLLRARLLRLEPSDYWFILSAHHIICDGWSMALVLRDLGLFYSAASTGSPPAVLAAQPFSDYAAWVAQQEKTETYQRARQFWLDRLQGNLPVLQLPTDRPHPPLKTYSADRYDHALEPELVQGLKKLGAKAGASFFTVMLTSYAVFLERLTGQHDLVIGVPAAGQSASGLENVVGHCVNLLPIRCQLDPASTYWQCLQQMRTHVLDAYDHQQITFGQLLPHLKVPRDPSRTPLVSAVFNLDQAALEKNLAFAGLEVEYRSNPRHFENFEFFINASEAAGRVVLECQYNKDLFDDETIHDWLESFEALLAGAVVQPDETAAKLPMLSRRQQQRILVDWNATQLDYPRDKTVTQLLDEQAQRTPLRPAVTFGNATVTYAELDRRANQLAHHLAAQGVGRNMLVGLCMERSLEMVVGQLAILKTGAGYVPLDPKYPRERLTFMVEDSKAALVLTQEKWRGLFAPDKVRSFVYEREAAAVAGQPAVAYACGSASPRDVAYVIYTSGSTGTPKGVAVLHGNVVNLLASMRQSPGIGADDVMLAVTTLSFDIAVAEILLPLAVGAHVVLASQQTVGDGRQLLQLLQTSKATVMQGTPATWRVLLSAGWLGETDIVVWCGGEALPADLARALLDRSKQLWNVYGPTETTVWSTSFLVTDPTVIRLGKPLGNTQAYVLDGHGQPVPAGVLGELYLGGAGVAAGYLHRPELTEQRFVANPYHDPFADYQNPNLYRTGDLVRWRRDGTLEYVGRNDHQVKLRGYRIELGEIESTLSAHPGVRQAVAAVRTDRPNDPRLVAYVVPGDQPATATELRKHLRQHLPDYMIPQHFVDLDVLPLTNNGKVDRGRLPPPFAIQPQEVRPQVLTPAQKYVLGVCKDVLQVEAIGVADNFFQVGGHSLLAFEVLARLEKETGARLPPSVLILDTLGQVAEELPADRIPKG
jgi:amino acid adenylation domain-containing protein